MTIGLPMQSKNWIESCPLVLRYDLEVYALLNSSNVKEIGKHVHFWGVATMFPLVRLLVGLSVVTYTITHHQL